MAFRNRITRISQLIADIFQTDVEPNQRIKIWKNNLSQSVIEFFSGLDSEDEPSVINVTGFNTNPDFVDILWKGAVLDGSSRPHLRFRSWEADASRTFMELLAGNLHIEANPGNVQVIATDGVFLGDSYDTGRRIFRVGFGAGPWSTDASGDITITHDMAIAPVAMTFLPALGDRGFFEVHSINSSSFKIRCFTPGNVVRGSGVNVGGRWIGLA